MKGYLKVIGIVCVLSIISFNLILTKKQIATSGTMELFKTDLSFAGSDANKKKYSNLSGTKFCCCPDGDRDCASSDCSSCPP